MMKLRKLVIFYINNILRRAPIQYHQVDSSMMSLIGYDEKTQTLHVLFNNSGQMYEYYEVEKEVFEEFLESDSKVGYFSALIGGAYDYDKFRKR